MAGISSLLVDKTPEERANIKATEIAKLDLAGKFTDKATGIEVEIVSVEKIEGGVQVFARAWKDGKQLGFGEDGTVDVERFRFFNPPVKVPDGTKRLFTDPVVGNVSELDNFKEDPAQALRNAVIETVKLVQKDGSGIVADKVGNTVSTFYPEPGTTVDGYAYRTGTNLTWTDIRGGAGTNSGYTDASTNQATVRHGTTSSNYEFLVRSFFLFTTSAIGTDTISSAVFSSYGSAVLATLGGNVIVDGTNPASNTVLANSDYGTHNFTAYSTTVAASSWSTSAYNDFTLNATGIAAINKTGITKLGLLLENDQNNASYDGVGSSTQWTYCQGYYADETGTSKDPKLVVTHAAGAGTAIKDIISAGLLFPR